MNPSPAPRADAAETPALGEAYSKAMSMLSPERQKAWAQKLVGTPQKFSADKTRLARRIKNKPRTRPLARDEIQGNTNRNPLAR
jgi:hypothetical protein